jgi:hypothetical protein
MAVPKSSADLPQPRHSFMPQRRQCPASALASYEMAEAILGGCRAVQSLSHSLCHSGSNAKSPVIMFCQKVTIFWSVFA